MDIHKLRMISPLPVYLDEKPTGSTLALRPASLYGKIVGLLPNWRPAAVHILKALGALIEQSCHPKAVVMEPRVHEMVNQSGNLIDRLRARLDDLAQRVDVVILGTGD